MDKKVPPKKARQGRSGFPVLMVLLGGLALAAIGWIGVEIYGYYLDEQRPVEVGPALDEPLDEDAGAQPDAEPQTQPPAQQ